jgi:hypothetical protein
MKLYKLSAIATVSIYAEVEADSFDDAIENAHWTCYDVDGEPQDIRIESEELVED